MTSSCSHKVGQSWRHVRHRKLVMRPILEVAQNHARCRKLLGTGLSIQLNLQRRKRLLSSSSHLRWMNKGPCELLWCCKFEDRTWSTRSHQSVVTTKDQLHGAVFHHVGIIWNEVTLLPLNNLCVWWGFRFDTLHWNLPFCFLFFVYLW